MFVLFYQSLAYVPQQAKWIMQLTCLYLGGVYHRWAGVVISYSIAINAEFKLDVIESKQAGSTCTSSEDMSTEE